MANLFGAIDVGSHEIEMKIFELSRKNGIRQLDDLVHLIDLGTDTYHDGRISPAHIAEVKRILLDFRRVMETYGVRDYRAYGTSAFREMENAQIVLRQIEEETGIRIGILSNSDQRFLDYKSIASKGEDFRRVIGSGTAIVDIGGGSIQISLFEKDRLVQTQNLLLGVLRLQEQLHRIDGGIHRLPALVEEIVGAGFEVFEELYLENIGIRNIIIVDDYISEVVRKRKIDFPSHMKETPEKARQTGEFVSVADFRQFLSALQKYSRTDLAILLGIEEENVPLLQISAVMVRCLADRMGADLLWFPCVTLSDGIVYEFAQERRYLKASHDFEQDILACAEQVSRRYRGTADRSPVIERIALRIFDSTRKLHGMGRRDQLLLQIAAILQDCGKYISMTNLGESGYSILRSTEIIGLSQPEQEIVACVVRFLYEGFSDRKLRALEAPPEEAACLTIARLTAILGVANALDRSRRHKFRDLQIRNLERDRKMVITVETGEDIRLEKGLFGRRADFFEEVFGLRPVIRQKKGKLTAGRRSASCQS